MKNMKKTIALVLAFVLTIVASVGATVAWLTAEAEPKTNVFTVGSVDIKLEEEVGVEGEGAIVTPVVDEEGVITGHEYNGAMPGDKLIKKPTVTNTGNKAAYVAITVTVNNALAINKAIDEVYENDPYNYSEEQLQAVYDEVFEGWGLNYTKKDAEGNALGMRLTITGDDMPEHVLQVDSTKTLTDYSQFYNGNWFGAKMDIIPFDEYYTAGMDKYELKYVYYALLQPGETVTVFEGLNVPEDFNAAQLAMFDGLTITVGAKAIQADNMPTPQYAFMVLNGDEVPDVVNNVEELADALANGGNYVVNNDVAAESIQIPAGADTQLDLLGNNMTANYIESNGDLTLDNGVLNVGTPADYGFIGLAGSETVMNNVDVKSAGGGIAAVGGAVVEFNSGSVDVSTTNTSGRYLFYLQDAGSQITINGGDFSFSKTLNQKRAYVYAGAGTTVYINGGNFGPASTRSGYTAGIMGEGTIIIKGGTFGCDPSAWVADGYEAVKDGTTWTVSAK